MNRIKNTVILIFFMVLNLQVLGQENLYLNQPPPGNFVKRFPPTNFLSTPEWFWHGAPCFSPAGDEMYFVIRAKRL